MSIFTAAFAKAAAERAISTAAQSAIAMLSADGLGVLNTCLLYTSDAADE